MLIFFNIPLFLFWLLMESLMKRQALQSALLLLLKRDELLEVCDCWPCLLLFELLSGKKDRNSPLICTSSLKLPEINSLQLNSSPY